MEQDLITNNFIETVNREIIRRNVALAKAALVLWILYSLGVLWDLYDLLKDLTVAPEGLTMIYYYKILPVIDVALLAVNTYGYILIVRGYRAINASFEKPDPGLLATGFKYFYTSNVLLIISITVSVIAGFVKHFL